MSERVANRWQARDIDGCYIEECDELPEDHYHPLLTQDVLARAIADAFAEHVAIADPRWPHMIAGYVIEKLPAGIVGAVR